MISAAVKSFPNGSAGGVDGLRPQHLKDMLSPSCGLSCTLLLSELTRFSNICLEGRIPVIVRPVFAGASLCALAKKDGTVRPIAVGCTLRRLIAKTASRSVSVKCTELLLPSQLGFGVKNGCEAAVYAARCYIKNLLPGQAVVKLDFANAFNCIHRDNVLNVVKSKLPELFNFVNICYADESFLCFDKEQIKSAEGVQQGDPLAPLLFCLTVLNVSKHMTSELNLWYMDDATLGGNVSDLLADIEHITLQGQHLGLQLNFSKCEVITNDPDVFQMIRSSLPLAVHVSPSDATLLGAAVGDEDAISSLLTKKLHDLQQLSDRLKLLDTHDAFFLLKNCFALPRLMYTLRTNPCFDNAVVTRYDDLIRSTLQSILNVQLTDSSWKQAILPVRLGGLGIQIASRTALPAYLSSVCGSANLSTILLPDRFADFTGPNDAHFLICLDAWKNLSNSVPPDSQSMCHQRNWMSPLDEVSHNEVLSAAHNQVDLARLTAVAAPHSGAFLQAIPMSMIGTRLDDTSFRIAVAIRLGAPVCTPHQCICGALVEGTGLHGLSCRKSSGRIARHSAINGLIKTAL